jgi:hypothetical protein
MKNFITLQIGDNQKSVTINKSHIVMVESTGSGHCIIVLSNGESHKVVNTMYSQLSDKLMADSNTLNV